MVPSTNLPRPSTAAAVAATSGGFDSDALMLGDGDDYDMKGNKGENARPSTAGAMGSRPAATSSSWGFQSTSRPAGAAETGGPQAPGGGNKAGGGGGAGIAEYGPDGQRRPHTAHGSRVGAAFPSQLPVDPRKAATSSVEDAEGEDAHVVAGARAMMRYRRTRAATLEGAVGGGPDSATGSGGGHSGGQGNFCLI